MIRIENVSVKIGKKELLRNVNLQITEGSICALMGWNGAGKTMILKLVMGMIEPTTGDVFFNGRLLCKDNRIEILSQIGVLIESPALYSYLTVYQNLQIRQKMLGLDPLSIDRAVGLCSLEEHLSKKAGEISLGTKQRLGLALAFLAEPAIIILDEPSNALDPKAAQEFRKLVKKINTETNTTFLISSHSLEEVGSIASHICFIDNGEIVGEEKYRARPQFAESTDKAAYRYSEDESMPTVSEVLAAKGLEFSPVRSNINYFK